MAGPVATFVLLLRPSSNGEQSARQTIRLPNGQKTLETQIVVPSPASRYDVRVQSASGDLAYRDLAPRTVKGVSYVEVMVPHDRLNTGTYLFVLLPAGSAQALHQYTVDITTQ